MLNNNVIQIAVKQFKLETIEQNEKLISDIGLFQGQMSARGVFQSSMTIKGIQDLCTQGIKNRSLLLWKILYRAITTSGISFSEELADELKEIVNIYLPESIKEIKNIFQIEVPKMKPEGLLSPFEGSLDEAYNISLQKVHAEIDLFVQSVKGKERLSERGAKSYEFHFYSPVAAVQTGDYSTVNVSQRIDTEAREKMRKVLKDVEEAISKIDALPNHPKDEILEIVKEGQLEIEKAKPNKTKLGGLLATISMAVQTVGSIKPAYELLKQVSATYLGIQLP